MCEYPTCTEIAESRQNHCEETVASKSDSESIDLGNDRTLVDSLNKLKLE